MKKILLMLVGVFTALAANADLYVVGPGTTAGWTPKDAIHISESEIVDGYYTFTLNKNDVFEISSTPASDPNDNNGWAGFNEGQFEMDGNGSTFTSTTSKTVTKYNLKKGTGSKTFSPSGKLHVRVSVDFSTMELSEDGNFEAAGGGDDTQTYNYRVHTNAFGEWGDVTDGFIKKDANTYEYTLKLGDTELGSEKAFLIKWYNGDTTGWYSWTQKQGSDRTYKGIATTYSISEDNKQDFLLASNLKGDIKFVMTVADDGTPQTLTISGGLDEYVFHIHNFSTQAQIEAVSSTNPYEFIYSITAPLASAERLGVHRVKGSTQVEDFGFDPDFTYDCTEVTKSLTAGKQGIILPANLKGQVKFVIGVTDNEPTTLTISGGEIVEDTYTYYMWNTFKSDDFVKDIAFRKHNDHYDAEYTFDGTEKGFGFKIERYYDESGLPVTGTRYSPNRHSEGEMYSPSTTGISYDLSGNGTVTPIFTEDIRGKVSFRLYVKEDGTPVSINVSGGYLNGDHPSDKKYTVYYYGDTPAGEPYAYIVRKEGNNVLGSYTEWWSDDNADREKCKLSPTGKYIKVGEDYKPVYALSFDWEDYSPTHVTIHNGDTYYTKADESLIFVNHGYYANGATVAETGLEQVYKPGDEPVTFYMHFKYDFIRDGEAGTLPRCYAFSGDKPSAEDAYTNGKDMSQITDPAPNSSMTVTEKYQIWKCEMSEADMKEKDNVCFVFKANDGTYHLFASENAQFAEPAFLTKYIFATAGDTEADRHAVQTYMPYEDFRAIDAQGRPNIYMVGESGCAIEGLVSGYGDDHTYTQWGAKSFPADHGTGCFYIPLKVDKTNQKGASFKISWVDVKKAQEDNKIQKPTNQRGWATFDLGIVGPDHEAEYKDGFTITYDATGNGKATCQPYGAIRYINYNQADWIVKAEDIDADSESYMVIDTHDACRTVTLIPYDPSPSVDVVSTGVKKVALTPEQAKQVHGDHSSHLNGADANGHIYMDLVNVCTGSIKINAASNFQELIDAEMSIGYEISMNGNLVVSTDKPATYTLDYLPLAANEDITVRATYDTKSGFSFHSRLGEGKVTLNGVDELAAPEGSSIAAEGQFVMDPRTFDMGAVVKMSYTRPENDYACYADFDFDKGVKPELLHQEHRVVKTYTSFANSYLPEWEFLGENNDYDFVGGANNWSGKIAALGAAKDVCIFISHVADSYDSIEKMSLNGTIYAVYPFLYKPNAELRVVAEASLAARRAPGDVETIEGSLEGLALTNMRRSVSAATTVSTDNALTGIENVQADNAAEAEYYNLQGIRVYGDPAPGVYLVRKGNAVEKVFVK